MSEEEILGLSRLLERALRRLGEVREREDACRLAADAWALLERRWPREARRFDGTLHYLACVLPVRDGGRPVGSARADGHVDPRGSQPAGGEPAGLRRGQRRQWS
jgi:hypothetical protein